MILPRKKSLKALAVFLAFAIAQISVQLSFAEPTASKAAAGLLQTRNIIVGRLTTSANRSIVVNGSNASTGATILTGATISTPADTGATIHLGAIGTVDLAPNTTIKLEFSDDRKLKITLITGCVIVNADKKTEAEVATEQGGTAKKKEKGAGGAIDACFPAGANAPVVGQGAAAAAGAGASAAGGAGAAAATTTALSTSTIIAIVAGGGSVAIGLPLAFKSDAPLRGGNPSPSGTGGS
jgi:hypothetical protein